MHGARVNRQGDHRRRSTFLFGNSLIALMFLASSVPSPLYEIYQREWHFSSLVLTGIFAVYAFVVVVTLNILGPLSDRFGRRRFAVAGLSTLMASMVVFVLARDVDWLLAARALQGLGVGMGSAALTAAVVELRPDDATAGAVSSSVSSNIGLGVGALGGGLAATYLSHATVWPYVLLAVLFALALPACRRLPAGRSVRTVATAPVLKLGLPLETRAAFLVDAVALAAAWAVGGLYMSLGPSIATMVSGTPSPLVGGVVVSALGFVGALVTGALRRWSGDRQMRVGGPVLVAGLLLVVWACSARSEALFIGASFVLAWGWGLLNVGSFRSLISFAGTTNRAAVVSAVYMVSYLAFSVPTVLVGLAVGHYGLRGTTVAFGVVAACVVTGATVTQVARRPKNAVTEDAANPRSGENSVPAVTINPDERCDLPGCP